MNRKERAIVENILKQTMYQIANQFLSTEVTTEIENESSTQNKNETLKNYMFVDA